jgi:UDP-glucose 4-epimerase
MNILITGDLSSIASSLGKSFAKEKHKTVFVSENVDDIGFNLEGSVSHSYNPANIEFREILASYKFNIIIYIASREEQLDGKLINSGEQLDGLRNALELCRMGFTNQFFFISSSEIYGSSADTLESTEPRPETINGHTLYSGEQYCKFYANQYNLNITVLRVPFVYGPNEKNVLLYKLIRESKEQAKVTLPAKAEVECSFLHTSDIADLIIRAMDDTNLYLRAMDDTDYSGFLVVNLSTSKKINFTDLAQLLSEKYPKVEYLFSDKDPLYTKPATVATAKDLYGWIDLHELRDEFPSYANSIIDIPVFQETGIKAWLTRVLENSVVLKWVELLGGAVVMQFLSEFTGTLIQFKYVDFRLLFVVLMGLVYGIRFGLIASILASLSVFYTWYNLEYDWALLAYNVGNWFPFAVYFTAGIITGYNRDKLENIIEYERNQKNLIYDKYGFLYGVFEEIRDLKDEFRQRLIGYRDSFGKIYQITRELDTLQEQEVYLRALSIFENLLENESIAIYTLDPSRLYARLQVSSKSLGNRISKSLQLSEFPEIQKFVEQGEIFQNSDLTSNYPAYVAPFMNNAYPFNVSVAIVVVWDAKFEQYSTYYYNLFKVISALVQDSLVRATTFLNANYEKMYLPATNILTFEAFVDTLRVRENEKKRKIAEYQLLRLNKDDFELQEFSSKISQGIRAVDIMGIWSDGSLLVLLSQADAKSTGDIESRLKSMGVISERVNGNELLKQVDGLGV